jgi:light-regulated signal transduction histidine kinase (bacteriophytochrome)
LKAPLRSITGFLYLIATKYSNLLDTNGIELIQFAEREAHKMKIMIEDLTKYSRINSHFQDEIIVDLNEVVEEVKETLEQTHHTSDYGIVLNDSVLPKIKCNKHLITQLWYHLINNAIKFSPSKRLKAEISVQTQPNLWLFFVKDNGIGMEKIYHQRLSGLAEG